MAFANTKGGVSPPYIAYQTKQLLLKKFIDMILGLKNDEMTALDQMRAKLSLFIQNSQIEYQTEQPL